MIEYTIKIKGTEHSHTKKLIAETPFLLDESNPELRNEVNALMRQYQKIDPEEDSPEVSLSFKMEWVGPIDFFRPQEQLDDLEAYGQYID